MRVGYRQQIYVYLITAVGIPS